MASATKRWGVILVLLAATLVAVARVSGDGTVVKERRTVAQPDAVNTSSILPISDTKPAVPDELRVTALSARAMDGDIDGVFTVPPKPVPEKQKTAAPEAPQAPPLPLHLLGKMTDNGALVLFLTWNDLHLVARVGDVIEETYRLEAIAGGQAEFVYLPLKIKQSLPVGEDS